MSDPLPALPPADPAGLRRHRLRWLCRGWELELPGQTLLVRGARTTDVDALLLMHGRCSPATLAARYRLASPPPRGLLRRLVAAELSLVAVSAPSRPVALGTLAPHDDRTAALEVLVEDAFQRRGIGLALARQCAAAARLLGYRHLSLPSLGDGGWGQEVLPLLGITGVVRDDDDGVLAALGHGALAGLPGPGGTVRAEDLRLRPAGSP